MKPLRPYLYHAYYQWIVDNDQVPYLLVNADYPYVDVPSEYVRDGKIILNISPRSVRQYMVDDEGIRFKARFSGVLCSLSIPFGAVEALYARENGDGVMFQEEAFYQEAAYLARLGKAPHKQAESAKASVKKASHLKLIK